MKKTFILIISLLFFGCSSHQTSLPYGKLKSYEQEYQKLLTFAQKGFPKHSYKLARMIYLSKINKPPYIERKFALYAYKHGFPTAAIMIADAYFKEKKYEQALQWYSKSDLKIFREKDFKNYLASIRHIQNPTYQANLLIRLEEYATKNKHPILLTLLGKEYLQKGYFYNPNKAENFFKIAYERYEYIPAGVELGIYYVQQGNKRGFWLLNRLAQSNAKAALALADALYNIMIQKEKENNSPCITTNFTTPQEYFRKKLTLYKFNRLFTIQNIITLYKKAYTLGTHKALYKIIRLDIEDDTFQLERKTYCGYDLNQTVKYLINQKDIESKLILAKIYEKYTLLKRYKRAKEIYTWYINIDKIQAYWHLYQYLKKFENKIDFHYLNYLSQHKFVPAIIEKAYQEILIEKNIAANKATLEYYSRQKNILALNYLGSLYAKNIFTPKNKSIHFYTLACRLQNKPFAIPSEDLKIANYYKDTLRDDTKYLTVNYYYAQIYNPTATINITKFYKKNCHYKKLTFWASKIENLPQAQRFYYTLVLNGYIKKDVQEALAYFKKQNDPISYTLLGDYYANGYYEQIDLKKAEKYYDKAIESGDYRALLKKASLYMRLDFNAIFEPKIISTLEQAIKHHIKEAYLALAKYHLKHNKKSLAIYVIESMPNYIHDPEARYLLYRITQKEIYIRNDASDYGYLLLAKATVLSDKRPLKALYYSFRAQLCNTPNAAMLSLKLIKAINNKKKIKYLYQKAKSAPRCYLRHSSDSLD